jgi:NTP pyrophosphatase (non-canonical NTP hydrolase)
MSTYAALEIRVVRWGEARGIAQNSTGAAQAVKTLEECHELIQAYKDNDREAVKDALGDILVTLIMGAACEDLDLVNDCLAKAYGEIKDRKGYLTQDGIFVKES